MAYVPPHKRHHSKDDGRPLPSPAAMPPFRAHLNQNPRTNSSKSNNNPPKTVYARKSIYNWFIVDSHDDDDGGGGDNVNQFSPSLQLRPISVQLEPEFGEKPLVLVDTSQPQHQAATRARRPWEVVAAKTVQDLFSSFENVRSVMEDCKSDFEKLKPVFVARFGKIVFHGGPSFTGKALGANLADETMLKQFRRRMYTNLPASYMEKMIAGLPLELGLELDYAEKDLHLVMLFDANRPETTIACKCRIIKEQNKLQLYKIEINYVRRMVTDVSCATKNLDLRLMLWTKRMLTALTDDEKQCIQNLIDSAIIDSNVKGGLRWPLGKTSSGDRFSVVGVWHTKTKAYVNRSLRLKARHADRYCFLTSTGESTSEVFMTLKEIVSVLQVQKDDDTTLISKMLEDTLKLIWDQFLNCDQFLG